MRLSSEHKRFLLSEQLIAPAAINFLANGAISWLSLKNASEIRYWAASSIGPDLLMTGFLLPFIMCMINSRLVAGKVYSGALDHIPPAEFGPDGWHRKPILVRSLFLGLVAVAVFAVPTVLVLPRLWVEPLALWGFVVFKGLWGALLAALISPVIAVWAMESASEERRNTGSVPGGSQREL